jgi:hypothetical protein
MAPTDEQYDAFFGVLHRKTEEYRGRMRVYFHEMGLLEELRYRLHHPAALLIVLPNGLVKLINALPFVCGDLRRQTLGEIWGRFQLAWQDPRVAQFVEDLAVDPRVVVFKKRVDAAALLAACERVLGSEGGGPGPAG